MLHFYSYPVLSSHIHTIVSYAKALIRFLPRLLRQVFTQEEELGTITAETQKEEESLLEQAEKAQVNIEDRLLFAYSRLRKNAKNGLAVVTIRRDSCSGCFNQIPPQRQLDIRQRKKIIVCEHCGRILVDEQMALEEEQTA